MLTKKEKKIFCGVFAALLLIAALVILLLLRSCAPDDADTPYARYLNLNHSDSISDEGPEQRSVDEILADLNRQVAEGMITMSMNPDPVFAGGTAKGSLLIHNDESNRHAQVVQIVCDDTEELIYTSGAVPVGKHLNSDTLDVDLDAGDYPCTAYFNSVDETTGEILGTGAVKITVHVQN